VIEKAPYGVSGVRGVHNILVSKIGNTDSVGVSLHIQVNRSATLTEAHAIANTVEDSIRKRLNGVESITVHLEPLMPSVTDIQPVDDAMMQDSISEIILGTADIKRVNKIATYRAGDDVLKIDVNCVFDRAGSATIEQIHERVSDIEKQIRARYPGSIVTIHAEPG
jgi:divalent metal cation (Fe/Co/Zn/Cd) transporter